MSADHSGHGGAAQPAAAAQPGKAAGGTTNTCPMHPEIQRSEPGNCPKCGMTLVPVEAKTDAKPAMAAPMPGMALGGADVASDGMGDMMGDAHRAMLWPHCVVMMLGFWLITAPWVLDGAGSPAAQWASVVAGLLIIGLSIPRGSIKNSYGGYNIVIV